MPHDMVKFDFINSNLHPPLFNCVSPHVILSINAYVTAVAASESSDTHTADIHTRDYILVYAYRHHMIGTYNGRHTMRMR